MVSFGFNAEIEEHTRSRDCSVYRMKDGDGVMTCYHVMPGVDVIYNDFHMERGSARYDSHGKRVLSIDHCREGRIEWEHKDGTFCYLGERDLQASGKTDHVDSYGFPTRHYHGITVNYYIDECREGLKKFGFSYDIDMEELFDKFCRNKDSFIVRSDESIQHIFSELYVVPDEIRMDYLKLKVMELLLFLCTLDISGYTSERPYFSRSQVAKIKDIEAYIRENMGTDCKLACLSEKFGISMTAMKSCFKGIYGMSIYAYIKNYRMNTAAEMLRNSEESITDIAFNVGYLNPSKFSSAFKSQFGCSPMEYKKANRS
ncbi:MAG: helix-turn-helix transcriptional regulator [Firmicutes bacterium]|nr:helix-turn-helix transcriptional regulator [Bacillota bacterium]